MNAKWAKKGLDPTQKYKITAAQWAVFLEQKNNPDFQALSQANSDLAKKNKYPHCLGTGGYERQIPQWRAEDEAQRAKGEKPMIDVVGPRPSYWVRARKPKRARKGKKGPDPNVEEKTKAMYALAAKEQEGTFKSERERDILTEALGNPEHPGRVRGISSRFYSNS